ncbi:MAG: cyclic pyranopterin monophosphate synthase MoaC [Planctomycetota bacterium]|nr:cyclic pyranopterin monophosphate synthase MoaC [Planctomycetota bacterium]
MARRSDDSKAVEGWGHLDAGGQARMVDVSSKAVTPRRALAEARLLMKEATHRAIVSAEAPKGDVLAVARVAGIQAAKRTGELIPLCHPLPLEQVVVEFSWDPDPPSGRALLVVRAEAKVAAKSGVERQALTAASLTALTVYDMCKGVDRALVIQSVRLLEKSGGQSGEWRAEN